MRTRQLAAPGPVDSTLAEPALQERGDGEPGACHGGCFLGVDVGSVAIGTALMDPNARLLASDYRFHQGDIARLLHETLAALDLPQVQQVAFTHRSGDFFAAGFGVNEQVALVEGVRHQEQRVGSMFSIGGETFGLILFDEKGRYRKYIANSSCAAGTGAFLDQQAERLGLADSAELSRLAEGFDGEPPKIATRCAVFAKTDLIHCQQQGYSLEAICAGLCRGLAHNIVDTLIKGVTLREPVVVVGGVSKNAKVMRYLAELIGRPVVIPPRSELTGAIGCALIARQRAAEPMGSGQFAVDTLLKAMAPASRPRSRPSATTIAAQARSPRPARRRGFSGCHPRSGPSSCPTTTRSRAA